MASIFNTEVTTTIMQPERISTQLTEGVILSTSFLSLLQIAHIHEFATPETMLSQHKYGGGQVSLTPLHQISTPKRSYLQRQSSLHMFELTLSTQLQSIAYHSFSNSREINPFAPSYELDFELASSLNSQLKFQRHKECLNRKCCQNFNNSKPALRRALLCYGLKGNEHNCSLRDSFPNCYDTKGDSFSSSTYIMGIDQYHINQ